MQNKRLHTILMRVGALCLLAGATLMITRWELSPYLYCLGALMFSSMQILDRYEGTDFTIKRLRRQQIFAAIMLLITGVLMFIEKHNGWIATLTIAAIIELYVAIRMPSGKK